MTDIRNVDILVNARSGSTTGDDAEIIARLAREAGYGVGEVESIVEGSITDIDFDRFEGDALIVLGGDGTHRYVLEHLYRPILPLPGGTMNSLPGEVLGTVNWRRALEEALARPDIAKLPAGSINGRRFYVGVILGEGTQFHQVREALRGGDPAQVLTELYDGIYENRPMLFELRAERSMPQQDWFGDVHCAIINLAKADAERPFKAYAIHEKSIAVLKTLGVHAVTGEPITDETLSIVEASRWHGRYAEPIPALIDGEFATLEATFTIEFDPEAADVWTIAP